MGFMGFGTNLKNILKDKGLTIKELSEKSGVSLNTLYSITKRDIGIPRYDIVIKISIALDIESEKMIEFERGFMSWVDKAHKKTKIHNMVDQAMRDPRYQIAEKKKIEDATWEAFDRFMLISADYLHRECGYGKKRLLKFIEFDDLRKFVDQQSKEFEREIAELLKNEKDLCREKIDNGGCYPYYDGRIDGIEWVSKIIGSNGGANNVVDGGIS